MGTSALLAREDDTLSLRKNAVNISKLSTIYFAGNVLPRALGLFLLPVFTAFLVPTQFGIVMLTARLVGPISLLMQLGLVAGFQWHYFRIEESERSRFVRTIFLGQFRQALLIGILLSVGGIWCADLLLPNLPLNPEFVSMLWLVIVWTAFCGAFIDLGEAVARIREQAFVAVGIRSLTYLSQLGLGLAVVVGLGWLGFGRQLAISIGYAFGALIAIRFLWRLGDGTHETPVYRKTLRTGLTFMPHTLNGLIATAVNAWLLAKFASPGALAIFGVALIFAQLMDLPLLSFVGASHPTTAKLMTDGSPRARNQQSRLYTLQILGLTCLAVGAAVFAPVAIRVLTAPEYHEAQWVVRIVILSCLCRGLYLAVAQPVSYIGGGFWLSTASFSSSAIGILLGFLLIGPYGAYGAAWAIVAGRMAGMVVAALVGYRLYPLPWEVTKIVRMLACGTGLVIADYYLSPNLTPVLALALKVGLVASLLPLLLLCRAIEPSEARRGLEMIKGRLRRFHLRFTSAASEPS